MTSGTRADEERTERLDEMFQAAFDGALDAQVIHEEGRIRYANRAAARLLGRASDAMEEAALLDHVAEGDQAAVRDRIRRGDEGVFELRVKRRDGTEVPVVAHVSHMQRRGADLRLLTLREAGDGAPRGRERLDRDAELHRLEQMNHFKTQLLNTAAHELNTPLTPLRLQVHLLGSQNLGELSERQQKAVTVLERNVERLSMLVNDILDVARLESGHLKIEAEDVLLHDLVEESVQSYEETARGVGVDLRLDADDEITVHADPRRVLQVLYNLVSNGIKFTPEGGRVTVRMGADDADTAFVEVADTGLGMDEDQLSRLFQPFSRVHDTEATAIPGTGLGLYISKGIIEGHGGELDVTSPGAGQGSTFRFTLPTAAEPVHHKKRKSAPKSPLVAGPLAERLRELI